MSSSKAVLVIHTAAVLIVAAAVVYFLVPRFESFFRESAMPLPSSTRLLLASYRYAFALPVFGTAIVWLTPNASRRLWLYIPAVYVIGLAAVAFTVWALYLPAFALAEGAS